MLLADKVSIITGGNSGIGEATARLFAREGAAVVIAARTSHSGEKIVSSITGQGGRACFVQCDVRVEGDCQNVIKAALDNFGRLDILFNNAGVVIRGSIEEVEPDGWDRMMDTNVKGIYWMCRAALPVLRKQGGGVIVNNASDAGLVGEIGMGPYCASKGAVVLLTKAMALDYAASGIRVNAVCPGFTYVDRWERRAKAAGIDLDDQIEGWVQNIPMGRVASIDEIAQTVLFLACDASSFITGAAIPVDGGNTAK